MSRAKSIITLSLMLFLVSCNEEENSLPIISLSDEMRNCILNPECQNSSGQLIIGFTLPADWDSPYYRGPIVLEAVYEGDSETFPLYK